MIRLANMGDAKAIRKLVNSYAKQGEMLQLSLNEIYEKIFEFAVWEENGSIIGCCALHPAWEDLAEIRSLAVDSSSHKKGVGKTLVEYCMERAYEFGITNIFALTYKPEFFKKLGFDEISKDLLPKKIWSDCLKCPMFPDCDEIAMMRRFDEISK
ncbi:MAG: N-acetyltransferase [Flexistipes sinusarabici]|uniref:N-acetyltransferase n=1 Tax=Flexistipes sinusarabici TaxID=2352 RepID=A0A5D0MMV1_FLESI|nr:N-acetyltransferase [Flexistipes sinusarabici]TYB32943.1 MAG: N-acetyltransferase [Flexistipes sinusarabici]